MNPTIHYQIATARIADLHRQAEYDRLAQATRRARRLQSEQRRCTVGGRPTTVLARCLYALLPTRPIGRPRAA